MKKKVCLVFQIKREHVFWQTAVKHTRVIKSNKTGIGFQGGTNISLPFVSTLPFTEASEVDSSIDVPFSGRISPAPSGQKIPLYDVAHSRAGDKGNDLNFSIIPHFPPDVERLKRIITPLWVKKVVSTLLNSSSFPDTDAINERDKWIDENVKVEIYEVKGIRALNVVVRDILDGGVNCSRRIDRHGKTISDLILCQQVVLPPWLGRSRTLIAWFALIEWVLQYFITCLANVPFFYHAYMSVVSFSLSVELRCEIFVFSEFLVLVAVSWVVLNLICLGNVLLIFDCNLWLYFWEQYQWWSCLNFHYQAKPFCAYCKTNDDKLSHIFPPLKWWLIWTIGSHLLHRHYLSPEKKKSIEKKLFAITNPCNFQQSGIHTSGLFLH